MTGFVLTFGWRRFDGKSRLFFVALAALPECAFGDRRWWFDARRLWWLFTRTWFFTHDSLTLLNSQTKSLETEANFTVNFFTLREFFERNFFFQQRLLIDRFFFLFSLMSFRWCRSWEDNLRSTNWVANYETFSPAAAINRNFEESVIDGCWDWKWIIYAQSRLQCFLWLNFWSQI